MERKTATKTIPSSSRVIATLGLSQPQRKRLAEVLLDKTAGDIYVHITSEGSGEGDRTTTITVLPASKPQDFGLDPRSSKNVGEIRSLF
jgi:hypothetical protein